LKKPITNKGWQNGSRCRTLSSNPRTTKNKKKQAILEKREEK
jgi:hypothetical protein